MLYKRLKILPEDRPSNAYLPASFAENSNLQLLNGANLENEILLTFKKPEVESAQEQNLYSHCEEDEAEEPRN